MKQKARTTILTLIYSLLFTAILIMPARATNLKLGANAFAPPYVLKDTDSGAYLEIVLQVLNQIGHKPEVIYLSNQRINLFFEKNLIELALYYSNNYNYSVKVYPSDPILNFKNGFICINKEICKQLFKHRHKFRVIGFQNAKVFIDNQYKELVESIGKNYSELANQRAQVIALVSGETDAIFMDFNIFNYYFDELKKVHHPGIKKDIKITQIDWKIQPKRSVAFKDETLRDRFNTELRKFKQSGQHQKILKKYNIEN